MTRELKPCGTWAAYQRHLRNQETPCTECAETCRRRSAASRACPARPVPACDDDATIADILKAWGAP